MVSDGDRCQRAAEVLPVPPVPAQRGRVVGLRVLECPLDEPLARRRVLDRRAGLRGCGGDLRLVCPIGDARFLPERGWHGQGEEGAKNEAASSTRG